MGDRRTLQVIGASLLVILGLVAVLGGTAYAARDELIRGRPTVGAIGVGLYAILLVIVPLLHTAARYGSSWQLQGVTHLSPDLERTLALAYRTVIMLVVGGVVLLALLQGTGRLSVLPRLTAGGAGVVLAGVLIALGLVVLAAGLFGTSYMKPRRRQNPT